MSDTRYPYTYAYDHVRGTPGLPIFNGMSRSQASQVVSRICDAIGVDKEVVVRKLADAYLAEQNDPLKVEDLEHRLIYALANESKRGWE